MLQPSASRSNLRRPNRFFPDPTIRNQRPDPPKTPASHTTEASNNRQQQAGQSSIPAPSSLKLPSTSSSTSLTAKKAAPVTTFSASRQDPQQQQQQQQQKFASASAVKHQQQQPIEKDSRSADRRLSYTISGGSSTSSTPRTVVLGSGSSTPDQDNLSYTQTPAGRQGASSVLNSTVTLHRPISSSPYRLPEQDETEFRQNLNRPVCVGGEKLGVLRYFGPLHMVEGLFCGIELNEAVGQHDGQVDGRRYFRAAHNRGIFAPMDKVELIDKVPSPVQAPDMEARPTTASAVAELILPADAEYLTDVEPHLMCHSILDQSSSNVGQESFELSDSLMFLKGSRFPGMDISMTPDQLAAHLRGGRDEDYNAEEEEIEEEDEEDEDDNGCLRPEDLEAAFLDEQRQNFDSEFMEEDTATPVFEEFPDFGTASGGKAPLPTSTPMTGARVHIENTPGGSSSTASRPAVKLAGSFSRPEATTSGKERPISTISADTGYQGDTEYDTQSGRSASPREMDATFERKQHTGKGNAVEAAGQSVKHEKPPPTHHQPHSASKDNDDGEEMNGSFESLVCETTIRDSRGRVVKVVKETKRVPKTRLQDQNGSEVYGSLVQQLPSDAASAASSSKNGGQSSTPSSTAPSSPSKTKRTKSESIGRESQRKLAKTSKVADAGNKENSSHHREETSGRPSSSGVGASPSRRKAEKPPEELVKKIVKATPKPSKHQEIMAKLQASMAKEKQLPKREVKSKFMAAIPATTPRSDEPQTSHLLSVRPSFLPTPRSRASSTASSLVNGSALNGRSSASSAAASEIGSTLENRRSNQSTSSKIASPTDEKQASNGEQQQAGADGFKVPFSPVAKVPATSVKKGLVAPTASSSGLSKNAVNNGATVEKKKSTMAVKKASNTGNGQMRDTPTRPGSSSGRTANGVSSISAASASAASSAAPRQPSVPRKSPTKEDGRLKELEVQAEQLKLAKERLCHSAKGFEVLSVMIRYYIEKVVPTFHSNLGKATAEISNMKIRIDELIKANDGLQTEKRQLGDTHTKALEELCRDYEQKMKQMESSLRSDFEKKTNELFSRHGQELTKVRDENARERDRLNEEFERQRKAEMERAESKMISLQEQHVRDVADLKALHQNVVDDLLRRFEEERTTMTFKMDEIRKQCDGYKLEARHLEETLMKDTEKKMSAVSERFTTYQSEVDSLRSVLEMKNQEIHELRNKCSLLEKDLEELPKCRTKIALLEQKNAELKEALDLKKQAERLFHQQHSDLLQSCERERDRNQRLSMDKEQLEFKLQKLIMSQSAYETPMGRMSSDESENDNVAFRSRTAPRAAGGASAALKDKPMSQSLIQIYAESSPYSPRSMSRTGHHDNKDLPVTVYMAAQDGEVAKVLQFDGEAESAPCKVKGGNGKSTAHSSSDSSPHSPPRGAKCVDKVSSPKRRISPLRRRNVSMSGSVAPMPATPEHPGDNENASTSDQRSSAEPGDPLPARRGDIGYDGHDPQDPAPHFPIMEHSSSTSSSHPVVAKTGCITSSAGWTDSGVFTTSCTSDTQEVITFGGGGGVGAVDHDATMIVSNSGKTIGGEYNQHAAAPVDTTASGHSSSAGTQIPTKNGAI